MVIEIKQIGITEAKGATWGRVFMDYIQDGETKFAFKNWIKFQEKNYTGNGSFETEPAFTTFNTQEITEDYMAVLEGEYDNMFLTPLKYKGDYGTPSKILMNLIQDIDEGLVDDIKSRRGWFNK